MTPPRPAITPDLSEVVDLEIRLDHRLLPFDPAYRVSVLHADDAGEALLVDVAKDISIRGTRSFP